MSIILKFKVILLFYNIYRELKIPCLETIYKSLVVNTNIVNKLKDKINNLCNTAEEIKYRTFKRLSLVPDVVQNTSKLNESRFVNFYLYCLLRFNI